LSKIHILPEHVANQIAAGEVIERPASVVKELVENAIDARSRTIFVSLPEEGVLRVLDDGEGMDRADAEVAFQRHATSKLQSASDLCEVGTLGFRGEALPSIAAVSKIRLVTQRADANEGTEIHLEAGRRISLKPIGAPMGSCFEIRDLFFNTPARKKFLKSAQTELSHISDTLFSLALSHPDIHFRLTHRARTLLDVPPVETLSARALQLFGSALLSHCMEAHETFPPQPGEGEEGEAAHLEAIFSRPPLRKNYRKEQYLFVNGRPIKSPMLTRAIYDAYGSYLMKGEHPCFAMMLWIPPSCVDVNVHPTKKEVRFQHSDWIYQGIRGRLRQALSHAGAGSAGQIVASEAFDALGSPTITHAPISSISKTTQNPPHAHPATQTSQTTWVGWPVRDASSEQVEERHAPPITSSIPGMALPEIRALGQVYASFVVAEIDGELILVDQHAMHERLLFESFLSEQPFGAIQPLLIPRQVDLPAWQADLLRDHLAPLAAAGFSIEPFGQTTFLVRETPAVVARMDLGEFLSDIAESLREGGDALSSHEGFRLNMIASLSCHSAIRAGQSLQTEEMQSLLSDYFKQGAPPTCPHGRPILMRYPKSEMEKIFRRK
jgi:DNA mismatch repair protein MutL